MTRANGTPFGICRVDGDNNAVPARSRKRTGLLRSAVVRSGSSKRPAHGAAQAANESRFVASTSISATPATPLLRAELAHVGWRGSRQVAVGCGDQNRASVSQDRPRLLAPGRPRHTDDGAAVHEWKESRSRRPEHGQRLPVPDKPGHERGSGQAGRTRSQQTRCDPAGSAPARPSHLAIATRGQRDGCDRPHRQRTRRGRAHETSPKRSRSA